MAAFESAVQAVSNRVNKQNNFKMPLDKCHEKLEDFSDEPAEKKRKEKKRRCFRRQSHKQRTRKKRNLLGAKKEK